MRELVVDDLSFGNFRISYMGVPFFPLYEFGGVPGPPLWAPV